MSDQKLSNFKRPVILERAVSFHSRKHLSQYNNTMQKIDQHQIKLTFLKEDTTVSVSTKKASNSADIGVAAPSSSTVASLVSSSSNNIIKKLNSGRSVSLTNSLLPTGKSFDGINTALKCVYCIEHEYRKEIKEPFGKMNNHSAFSKCTCGIYNEQKKSSIQYSKSAKYMSNYRKLSLQDVTTTTTKNKINNSALLAKKSSNKTIDILASESVKSKDFDYYYDNITASLNKLTADIQGTDETTSNNKNLSENEHQLITISNDLTTNSTIIDNNNNTNYNEVTIKSSLDMSDNQPLKKYSNGNDEKVDHFNNIFTKSSLSSTSSLSLMNESKASFNRASSTNNLQLAINLDDIERIKAKYTNFLINKQQQQQRKLSSTTKRNASTPTSIKVHLNKTAAARIALSPSPSPSIQSSSNNIKLVSPSLASSTFVNSSNKFKLNKFEQKFSSISERKSSISSSSTSLSSKLGKNEKVKNEYLTHNDDAIMNNTNLTDTAITTKNSNVDDDIINNNNLVSNSEILISNSFIKLNTIGGILNESVTHNGMYSLNILYLTLFIVQVQIDI